MDLMLLALVSILSLAGGWLGAYFGAYFREKGKNLATREDIDRITRITEDIKADVSGDLWERQNRWTFKKELYIRLLQSLGDGAACVNHLLLLDEQLPKAPVSGIPKTQELQDEYLSNLQTAMVEIRRAAFIVPLVCTEATTIALDKYREEWRKAELDSGRKYLEGCLVALIPAIESIMGAAREDLRLTSTGIRR